jgi:hypothetical protein
LWQYCQQTAIIGKPSSPNFRRVQSSFPPLITSEFPNLSDLFNQLLGSAGLLNGIFGGNNASNPAALVTTAATAVTTTIDSSTEPSHNNQSRLLLLSTTR